VSVLAHICKIRYTNQSINIPVGRSFVSLLVNQLIRSFGFIVDKYLLNKRRKIEHVQQINGNEYGLIFYFKETGYNEKVWSFQFLKSVDQTIKTIANEFKLPTGSVI